MMMKLKIDPEMLLARKVNDSALLVNEKDDILQPQNLQGRKMNLVLGL